MKKSQNNILKAREIKLLAHKFLPEYDLYCYHDANIALRHAPPDYPVIVKNPRRTTITEEANRCIELGKDKASCLKDQLKAYKEAGFKDDYGLFLNGYFVRENEPIINEFYERWYNEVKKYNHRDQVSLPFVMFKTGIKLEAKRIIVMSKYFIINEHKHNEVKDFNVHYITPGRADKQYGYAVNQILIYRKRISMGVNC